MNTKLQAYDRELERAWNDTRNLKYDPKALARLKARYFTPIYGDDTLMAAANALIESWTRTKSPSTFQIDLRKQWERVFETLEPENDRQGLLLQLYLERGSRWERLAEKLGIAVPDSFNVWRGVQGMDHVLAVATAWKADEDVRVVARSMASWSFKRRSAAAFAKGDSVMYSVDLPFENTIFDLWVDDSRFLSRHWNQAEVISAHGAYDVLYADKQRVTARFLGTDYGYDEKDRLLAALKAAGHVVH